MNAQKSSEQQTAQVVVVGSGPTGLLAAGLLAQLGVRVRLIEQLTKRSNRVRGVALHHRPSQILAQLGLLQGVRRTGLEIGHIQLRGPRQETNIQSLEKAVFDVDQVGIEMTLESWLGTMGVLVEYGTRLVGLKQHEQHTHLTLHRSSGSIETVNAAYVLACDGWNSSTRRLLGISTTPFGDNTRYAVIDFKAEVPLPQDSWHVFSSNDGPVFFFPLTGQRWRSVVALPRNGSPLALQAHAVPRLIAQRTSLPKFSLEIQTLSHVHLEPSIATRYREGRTFLLGDAAHIYPFMGNQGMNAGMLDAENIAWKLAGVLHGLYPSWVLDTYESERGFANRKQAEFLRKLESALGSSPQPAGSMRQLLFGGLAGVEQFDPEAVHRISALGIAYPGNRSFAESRAGSAHLPKTTVEAFESGPVPGSVAPDLALRHRRTGENWMLHELPPPGCWTLLVLQIGALSEADLEELRSFEHLSSQLGGRISVVIVGPKATSPGYGSGFLKEATTYEDLNEAGAQLYGVHESAAFLIRPDRVVAFRGLPARSSHIESYLDYLLRLDGNGDATSFGPVAKDKQSVSQTWLSGDRTRRSSSFGQYFVVIAP